MESSKHEPEMVLSDDGTLDTVIVCSICHQEYRYSFDSDEYGEPELAMREFIDWAKEDAYQTHVEDMQS